MSYKSDRFDDFKENHPFFAFLLSISFTILLIIVAICGFANSSKGLWPIGIIGTVFAICGIVISVDCFKTMTGKD